MNEEWELSLRTTIRAFRVDQHVLIVAEGDLPSPGYRVDIVPSPLRIFPQQYNLVRREAPGVWPSVVVPYRYAEPVRFPEDRSVVTVHHLDGRDEVGIEECGKELREFEAAIRGVAEAGTIQSTGFSPNLSFDEAFADALAGLPPFQAPFPDALSRVEVVDVGGLFGGIAGFRHLFVRVRRTQS